MYCIYCNDSAKMIIEPYPVPSGERHTCTRCGHSTIHPKSDEPKAATCPYCRRAGEVSEIRIINVTDIGVAFHCPKHQHSGMRRDFMLSGDKECFGEELDKIGMRGDN